jgi:hypothetical protein
LARLSDKDINLPIAACSILKGNAKTIRAVLLSHYAELVIILYIYTLIFH